MGLTAVGGGAFGNREEWVADAIAKALRAHEHAPLDVKLVHYMKVPADGPYARLSLGLLRAMSCQTLRTLSCETLRGPIDDDGSVLVLVEENTVLVAKQTTEIFASMESWDTVGCVHVGNTVVASGPQRYINGYEMVPIKAGNGLPEGAVELTAFAVQEDDLYA